MGRIARVNTGSGGWVLLEPASPMLVWAPVSPTQGYTAKFGPLCGRSRDWGLSSPLRGKMFRSAGVVAEEDLFLDPTSCNCFD